MKIKKLQCFKSIFRYRFYDLIIGIENFKKCYISCETCKEEGNYTKQNCLSCKNDYPYELKIDETINCYNKCDYYTYYNSSNKKNYCTHDFSCPEKFNKLITIKKQCIDNCQNDHVYQYEFNHTCFQECPINIIKQSEENKFYCKLKCPKKYPFEIVETQNCVDNCKILQRYSGKCIINYVSNDENNKEIEEKEVENIKKELTSGFNTSEIDKGTNIVIKQKDSIITITTTENQKNEKSSNLSTINLGDCEQKLKDEYNISKDKSLYILKIDVNQKGLKIPKIAYEVYYPLYGGNLIQLNLTVCKDSKIEISIPVELTDDIDKINPASEYYNDICYTYTSEDGTDVSLSDRKNNFVNNNLTLCEEGCNFNGYKDGKASCSCDVKTNSTAKIGDIVFDKNKLFESFTNFKNLANIKVLKCYKLIFNLNKFKHNYANFILIPIIILFLITFFIFYCHDYYKLKKILDLIVFFKLNFNLVKKFLERKKKEEQIKLKNKKIMENEKNPTTLYNKKGIVEDLNYPPPIYLKFLELHKKKILNDTGKHSNKFHKFEKVKINSIPKSKRNPKLMSNIIETNSYMNSTKFFLVKNNETTNEKNNIVNKKDYPYNMTENQMYEMFLTIYKKSDSEMNELSYNGAIKIDKRTYFEYYLSLLRTKHLIIFSFWPAFDYNSQILKIFLFFFNFTLSFVVNALFFNDETMHKIYEDKGAFDFIYNIPQILLSSLISGFINGLMETLALTDSIFIGFKEIINIKNIIIKKRKALKTIKIKILLFFIITLLLLIFFWYYLACFCAVYKNTQLHLIKDAVISFGTSIITPF